MDESTGTCNKRFAKLGIPQTVEARRAYRELIVTTPGLQSRLAVNPLRRNHTQQKSDEPLLSDAHWGVSLLVSRWTQAQGIWPAIPVKRSQKALMGCAIPPRVFSNGRALAKWRR